MAEDYTSKRRDLASKAIEAATRIVEGVNLLVLMGPELAQSGGGFADADFAGSELLKHVNEWKMNNLVNIVAPSLKAVSETPIGPDTPVTHKDILLAVKRA